MLPTTSFTVDGKDYTTQLMPATEALVLFPRLTRLFGRELLALLIAGGAEKLDNAEIQADMISTICDNAITVDDDGKERTDGLLVIRDLMRRTKCAQVQLANSVGELNVYENFDHHFSGDYMHLLSVAIKVAQASFSKPSSG